MTTLNKEFVPYEQALALKELGFDKQCFGEYRQWDGCNPWLKLYQDDEGVEGPFTIECNAPTFSQAFRWFRQKHNLQAEMVFSEKPDRFYYYIGNMVTGDMDRGSNMSYEEAELACLNKLIEIVKNK